MDKLADLSVDQLLKALEDADSAKATKRLMIALAYKDGVSVDTLSDRYGLSRSTVYSWLDRFEYRTIEAAICDDTRPGRPPKLDADQQAALREALAREPTAYAYDHSTWSPELLQSFIDREFGVSYSLGHVRRLMRELSDE